MESLEKIEEQKIETPEQETKERQLPVGIGGAELKKDRETLPAVEVANEVSWVNNKMNSPFDLKVGQQSRLGMFLTPNPQEGENIFNLEISGSHTRSGILGRVIFNDKEGRLYRDIDLKGMGYVKTRADKQGYKREVGPVIGSYGKGSGEYSKFSFFAGSTGITNQELIRRDIDFSEKFLKAGIRTHRVIALIDLEEVIDRDGKKISIAEAKEKGILSKEDEPVIEVRAFGVRSRLFDLENYAKSSFQRDIYSFPPKARKILDDAKNFVAQEQNIDLASFTDDDYFKWLADTTAINIARMHYHRWVSGYLTSHNITLDARLVDLDSVVVFRKDREEMAGDRIKSYEDDFNYARGQLSGFFYALKSYLPMESRKYIKSFDDTYKTELERLKSEKNTRKSKR